MKKIVLFSGLFILAIGCFAQQKMYDIYFPKEDRQNKCNYFLQAFQQKPREIQFGIKAEGNNLYFEIKDKEWFDLLFKKTRDGIAIDVVSKERYDCSVPVHQQQIRGELLPPVYAMQLKKRFTKTTQKSI